MARNLFVWIAFMNIPIGTDDKGEPRYLEQFTFLQLFGFMVIVFGVLVYNEILVLPCCGFNLNTRIAREYREKQRPSLVERRKIEMIESID